MVARGGDARTQARWTTRTATRSNGTGAGEMGQRPGLTGPGRTGRSHQRNETRGKTPNTKEEVGRNTMTKFKNWLRSRDEEGQGLAEYGLILALIAVVCVGAVTALGGSIQTALNSIAGSI